MPRSHFCIHCMNSTGWVNSHRSLILWVGTAIIAAWYAILLASLVFVPNLKTSLRAPPGVMLPHQPTTNLLNGGTAGSRARTVLFSN